ncbi:hypothetical protein [Magnetospirillum fulvum]|uniref:hypothetical protein n=1 Tax=Magnetospirillum fulvum TaxID=1082 RepID=UPI00041D79A2|nr:hypothetical protein [Magnetospirillum fulvum]
MGRKYKGDIMRFDDETLIESRDEAVLPTALQDSPRGLDPETCRRAHAVALRQIQARIPSFY